MKKISITLILSILIPGVGHLYLGSKVKGWILFILSMTLNAIAKGIPGLYLVLVIVELVAVVDAYKTFKVVNGINDGAN